MTLAAEIGDQMTADEAAAATDHDFIGFHHRVEK